jgi:hypothetical protein
MGFLWDMVLLLFVITGSDFHSGFALRLTDMASVFASLHSFRLVTRSKLDLGDLQTSTLFSVFGAYAFRQGIDFYTLIPAF